MFKRTIQSIYKPLTFVVMFLIGLMILSHIGDAAPEPEVWFSFTGKKAAVAEDASGNGNDGRIEGNAKRVKSKDGPYGMGIELNKTLD